MRLLVHNPEFQYEGYHRCSSLCDVKVATYRAGNEDHTIVIFTELDNNPGTSVTNMSEVLATMVVQQYKLDPQYTTFVERYPREPRSRLPEYSNVVYTWKNGQAYRPEWSYLKPEQVEQLFKPYGLMEANEELQNDNPVMCATCGTRAANKQCCSMYLCSSCYETHRDKHHTQYFSV